MTEERFQALLAKLKAEDETGIDRRTFPAQCPYTLEQSLSPEFFPGDSSDD
jgi:hypothetical protein